MKRWVTKGEEAALTQLMGISPAGREKLRSVWNKLPPKSRAKFTAPVQLLTLLLAMDILDEDGYEITGESTPANGETLLRVNRFKHGVLQGEKGIPFRQSPAGWQLVIPDELIEELPEAMDQASLYVPPARR